MMALEAKKYGYELDRREMQKRLLRELNARGIELTRDELVNQGNQILSQVQDGIDSAERIGNANAGL
jgi:hypothetical protein